MSILTETLVELYEEGVITKYEMFFRARGYSLKLPDKYQSDYEKWDAEHPIGECITFSITA